MFIFFRILKSKLLIDVDENEEEEGDDDDDDDDGQNDIDESREFKSTRRSWRRSYRYIN